MDAMGGVSLHPSEKFSGRGAIQTPFDEYNVGANLPQVAPRLKCQCALQALSSLEAPPLTRSPVCSALQTRACQQGRNPRPASCRAGPAAE